MNKIREADGLICHPYDIIDKEVIQAAKNLRAISTFSVGFDHIDIDFARSQGIKIGYTPEVLTNATAELTIALVLDVMRRVTEGDRLIRGKRWKQVFGANDYTGVEVSGKTIGILGMGRIGRALAKIAKSFGMEIHYRNRTKLGKDQDMGATFHESIKSLFSVSDVLSICCPATKETKDIINKETLEYFPTGAIITNVARGDIVDDEALIDALNRRKIYAAGLDVYKNEPNLNPGYLKIPSAFVLPHLGSATKDTRIAMGNLAVDNLDEFFRTGNCINKVN